MRGRIHQFRNCPYVLSPYSVCCENQLDRPCAESVITGLPQNNLRVSGRAKSKGCQSNACGVRPPNRRASRVAQPNPNANLDPLGRLTADVRRWLPQEYSEWGRRARSPRKRRAARLPPLLRGLRLDQPTMKSTRRCVRESQLNRVYNCLQFVLTMRSLDPQLPKGCYPEHGPDGN